MFTCTHLALQRMLCWLAASPSWEHYSYEHWSQRGTGTQQVFLGIELSLVSLAEWGESVLRSGRPARLTVLMGLPHVEKGIHKRRGCLCTSLLSFQQVLLYCKNTFDNKTLTSRRFLFCFLYLPPTQTEKGKRKSLFKKSKAFQPRYLNS